MGKTAIRTGKRQRRAGIETLNIPAWVFIYAPYALLIVAVFSAYADIYGNAFVYDDLPLIAQNKFLTSWHYLGAIFTSNILQGSARHAGPFYRPMQILLYLIAYQVAGPSPAAFHLLSVVLHALNACLLYALGVRLGFWRVGVLWASLLWAMHPAQSEAIDYISAMADPLCGVFLLSGILVLEPNFSRRRILGACLLFVLALLSKEVAVVFPLLTMGLLFYRGENRWSVRTYLKTWPFWLMTAAYFLLRASVLNFSGFFGYYDIPANNAGVDLFYTSARLYTFFATLPTYLQILVWPVHLHMMRNIPIQTSFWTPQVLTGCVILAAVIACIVWKPAQRATPFAWGMLWAAALHIPQSNLFIRSDSLMYEHWLYLPTMGLMLGMGESLTQLVGRFRMQYVQPALAGLGVLTAGLFGIMTFEQNKTWRDPITFYTRITVLEQFAPIAHYKLADIYSGQGRYDLAANEYRTMLASGDFFADAHYNLAAVLLKIDHSPATIAEATEHFKRVIELDPNYSKAYEALAVIYGYLGDRTKELEYRAKEAAIKKNAGSD